MPASKKEFRNNYLQSCCETRAVSHVQSDYFRVILDHQLTLVVEIALIYMGAVRTVNFARRRINRQLLGSQLIVRATLVAASGGVSPFRMCHY